MVTKVAHSGEGLSSYYLGAISALEAQIREKQHNLSRMEAQRNELNTKGALNARTGSSRPATPARVELPLNPRRPPPPLTVRMLREELQLLQEPGSYVGEVIKVRRK